MPKIKKYRKCPDLCKYLGGWVPAPSSARNWIQPTPKDATGPKRLEETNVQSDFIRINRSVDMIYVITRIALTFKSFNKGVYWVYWVTVYTHACAWWCACLRVYRYVKLAYMYTRILVYCIIANYLAAVSCIYSKLIPLTQFWIMKDK